MDNSCCVRELLSSLYSCVASPMSYEEPGDGAKIAGKFSFHCPMETSHLNLL